MPFSLAFLLPETAGRGEVRQSILDYIKTFVTSIDAVRKLEVRIRKRDISIQGEDFGFFFVSTKEFKMGFVTEQEKVPETINSIMNEVIKKLNAMENRKAKSEIRFACLLAQALNKKSVRASFSRLINKEALKDLKYSGMSFMPARLNFVTKKKAKKGLRARFRIIAAKKENTLELVLSNVYTDRFPVDIVDDSVRDTKEFSERILATLTRGKQ